MKPIKFKEANKCLSKPIGATDEECGSLWVYNDGKYSISCWNMSFKERLKALLFGKVWLFVWFGNSQPPVGMAIEKTIFNKNK